MILLYRILTNIIYPLLLILVYVRKFSNKEHQFRFKEKIFISNFNVIREDDKKLIWFHAASIGEFKSIVPIIKELNKNNNFNFLLTTVTLSSSTLAEEEFKNFKNIHHRFLPFDVNFLIKKFIIAWKPDKVFLVDSEIWPNLIFNVNKNKIPLCLINARLTAKSYSRWIRFPGAAKKIFNKFDLCLASNNETKDYLEKLNAKNIHFSGNIKLINRIEKKSISNINENFLLKKRFWLGASTHEGEDIFCLKVHKKIKKEYEDIVTIIAPRHINKARKISDLSNSLGLKTQLLNNDEIISDNKEIIIINSFGVLQNYFKYAKSVFIGKSMLAKLKSVGGQNPIDAAKLGCKIYHGPYVYNFEEIYDIFKKIFITQKIETIEELGNNLIKDLKNPKKEETKVSDHIKNLEQKIFEQTMKNINNFIK